jgi:hypothetical protein
MRPAPNALALRLPLAVLLLASLSARPARAAPPPPPPLLPEATVAALAAELSGEGAKRHLEFLTRQHRMRGGRGYRAAAEHLAAQLREAGLSGVVLERFPADGKVFYGTQRSRPAWDADFAELWEVGPDGARTTRLASFEAVPLTLAQDSASGEVTAGVVDVGEGTREADYAGREVRGKLVLAGGMPEAVAALAVERHGAAGILSSAQNQRTAWWGDDESLVRWGHLDTFARVPSFAFMLSLEQARGLKARLAAGEAVRLHARVRAGQHPSPYEVLTATLPGADARLKEEEVVFSCHLDHPRPGANDNASGAATLLEVARTLARLVREGRIPPPARTLRFVFPPEIEGTLALLTARPALARRIKAAVHLDMVGGGPATKAVFHVTRGPASLPSFVYDVAQAYGAFASAQADAYAATGSAPYPLVAPEGGKEALQAALVPFTLGSDHQVYSEGSFGIPAAYLNDWPDRYIHTTGDTAANIDPTKLVRAGFVAAATGLFLAQVREGDAPALLALLRAGALRRTATLLEQRAGLPAPEADALTRFHLASERALVDSLERFFPLPAPSRAEAARFLEGLEALVGRPPEAPAPAGEGARVLRRVGAVKGPVEAFGYSYLRDKLGAERVKGLRLLAHEGLRGGGGEYAYEALNLVDGRRSVQEVRDALSAIYGPVPLDAVAEYLAALASLGLVEPAGAVPGGR